MNVKIFKSRSQNLENIVSKTNTHITYFFPPAFNLP